MLTCVAGKGGPPLKSALTCRHAGANRHVTTRRERRRDRPNAALGRNRANSPRRRARVAPAREFAPVVATAASAAGASSAWRRHVLMQPHSTHPTGTLFNAAVPHAGAVPPVSSKWPQLAVDARARY